METTRSGAQTNSNDRPPRLGIQVLHLDPKNPRLPEEVQGEEESALLIYIAENYEPIEIARSISRHGFFQSEPLIVVEEESEIRAVEGNRRLTALKLLSNPELAHELGIESSEDWKELAASVKIPLEVPVVWADTRQDVAAIVGFRHISGIEPWEPYAKARFIVNLVEDQDLSFEEAADLIGESSTDVKAHYRNYRVARQAREEFGLYTDGVEQRFGVFTRAMSNRATAQFIGAPTVGQVRRGLRPIPKSRRKDLKRYLSWAFGDETQPAVIKESRDLSILNSVIASRQAIEVLEKTRDLQEAYDATEGPKTRLITRLRRARNAIGSIRPGFAAFCHDPEVVAAAEECRNELSQLFAVLTSDESADI